MCIGIRSILIFAMFVLIAGCSSAATSGGGGGGGEARPDPDTQRLPNVPTVHYAADIDTLADHLLTGALGEMHWASLKLDNQVTALRLTAITPADQPVEIRAQNIGNAQCAVQIRVGYFGDEKLERAFHDVLKDVVKRWREKQKK